MAIRPTFSQKGVMQHVLQEIQKYEKAIISNLTYLGLQCVNQARTSGNYRDQTGNLRNSVGYVIVKDGVIIKSNFKKSAQVTTASGGKSKGDGSGVVEGQALAAELAKDYPTGFALIVVAGMNYAASVETRGRDVLSSAEKLAQQELPGMLAKLKI